MQTGHRDIGDRVSLRSGGHYATTGARLATTGALLMALSLSFAWSKTPQNGPGDGIDDIAEEAQRLVKQAAARGQVAGGAVDLIRLDGLADWLPDDFVERALTRAAVDPKRAPLVQAVAHWLIIQRALRRLAVKPAAEAVDALGLLTGFAFHAGPAPKSTATLEEDGWRTYPATTDGVVRLDDLLRPARETRATLATRLNAPDGGPAVFRVGYDDAITLWLNGDEVYVAPTGHDAWLDQAAIPVVLRPGDNRVVVEVRQRSGPWRFLMRVTDAAGEVLDVTATPDPWGPCPEPLREGVPENVEHLWATLLKAADVEPPVAQDLRDLADYARASGLPDAERITPRIAMEGAWESDPSPRTLRSWLQVLPDDQRAGVRAKNRPVRPVTRADVFADARLALAVGWEHYYARRHLEARRVIARLKESAPGFAPVWRLDAVLHEDLNLPNVAVTRLGAARKRWPHRPALRRAHASALRAAGRTHENFELLTAHQAQGADVVYELAALHRARGQYEEAATLMARIKTAWPLRWTYQLEAAEIARASGDSKAALTLFEALNNQLPGEPAVAAPLARAYVEAGDRDQAVAVLTASINATADEDIKAQLAALTAAPAIERLGPSVESMLGWAPADDSAHVLYHHARAEVGTDGRATRRIRRVVRIQTAAGAQRFGSWSLPYAPGAQRLVVETARLLRPGQPAMSPSRTDVDLSEPDYRLYFDLRAEVLTFARPQPGDVIEVAWRTIDTDPDPAFPGYFGDVAYLQEATPRALSVLEWQSVADIQVEVHAPGIKLERGEGRIVARDVPGLTLESGMPGASSVRGYVHLSTAVGWAEIDQRYQRLLGERTQPNTQIKALADEWAGDAKSDEATLARLYAQVAQRVRYVGLEFGVRSFQPAHPSATLSRGYGDCKDKATLLIALARARGIEAHLALVRTRRQGLIQPTPASFAIFDHAIVYVPGLDRFMDPTVDRNDPWVLPPPDQGAFTFVVGVDKAPRIVPFQPAAANVTHWAFDFAPQSEGFVGTYRWRAQGDAATRARRQLEGNAHPLEVVESQVVARLPGAQVKTPKITGLTPAFDPVEATGELVVPAFLKARGGFDIPIAGSRTAFVAEFAQAAERSTPLEIELAVTRRGSLRLVLPPGKRARLPAPITEAGQFGTYRRSATLDADAVQVHVEFQLVAHRIDPTDYPAFRRWLSEVDAALSARIEVRDE